MNLKRESALNPDLDVPDSRHPTSTVVAHFMRRNPNGNESVTATLYVGGRGVSRPQPVVSLLIVRDPSVARSIMENARAGTYGDDVYMELYMPNGKTVVTNLNPKERQHVD
jgi:hypothetical protein